MNPIINFKANVFIEAAEELLRSDETLMALQLLDLLPSYYKDHPITAIEELKREIHKRMSTASYYATHVGIDTQINDMICQAADTTFRANMIAFEVKNINDQGLIPHLYDHGPAGGFLPFNLHKRGLKFTYEPVYVNHPTFEATKERFEHLMKPKEENAPIIWVATEIIEHLYDERELRFEMEARCGKADVIHISTPLYTFDYTRDTWRSIERLEHLRTYSPSMFKEKINSIFYDYQFTYYKKDIQHARLFNMQGKHDFLKLHFQVKDES